MVDARQTLVLGGGCFWCTESVYVQVRGVVDVESGYCNGDVPNPNYDMVCTGRSGYCEVVKLVYDPTTLNRQGADSGTQYRSGIYFTTPEQEQVAREVITELEASGVYRSPVVTEVLPLAKYAAAEDYHQDYFERNPNQGYCMAVAAPKVAKFRKTFAGLQKG